MTRLCSWRRGTKPLPRHHESIHIARYTERPSHDTEEGWYTIPCLDSTCSRTNTMLGKCIGPSMTWARLPSTLCTDQGVGRFTSPDTCSGASQLCFMRLPAPPYGNCRSSSCVCVACRSSKYDTRRFTLPSSQNFLPRFGSDTSLTKFACKMPLTYRTPQVLSEAHIERSKQLEAQITAIVYTEH